MNAIFVFKDQNKLRREYDVRDKLYKVKSLMMGNNYLLYLVYNRNIWLDNLR